MSILFQHYFAMRNSGATSNNAINNPAYTTFCTYKYTCRINSMNEITRENAYIMAYLKNKIIKRFICYQLLNACVNQ